MFSFSSGSGVFESYVIYALGKTPKRLDRSATEFESYVIYALGKTSIKIFNYSVMFESYVIYAPGKTKNIFSFIYIEFK